MIFADTSFLVPLYAKETRTPVAQKYAENAGEEFVFTPFHRLELRTALRLRVFRGQITHDQLRRSFQLIESDLQEGFLLHKLIVWADALREAEKIAEAYLTEVGARSGDLLLVASAVVLEATEFCTFDQRQTELAKRAGLKVKNWR